MCAAISGNNLSSVGPGLTRLLLANDFYQMLATSVLTEMYELVFNKTSNYTYKRLFHSIKTKWGKKMLDAL